MGLIAELRRRNVFRMAVLYLGAAWLVLQVVDLLIERVPLPESLGRITLTVLAIGFPIALVLSWLYEITPEGVSVSENVEARAALPAAGRRLDFLVIAVLAAAVLLFTYDKWWTGLPPDQSVAVLPFANMSNDTDQEYFSDGLTETLLNMLAQNPELKVSARTSSFAFRNENKTIREVADVLGVAHVLEGSVQRSGNRLRITAQLIRAADGFHIWSESYDRTIDDIFGIQDEIAEKVGAALTVSLLGSESGDATAGVSTDSLDAYDMYLRALKERSTFSHDGLIAAEGLLKRALAVDPDFIDAKTALVSNLMWQVDIGVLAKDDAYPEILALADQVLKSEPDNVTARTARLYAEYVFDSASAEAHSVGNSVDSFKILVAENPSDVESRLWLANLHYLSVQHEQAVETLEATLALDPLNPEIHFLLGWIYASIGQPEKSRQALLKSLELEPLQPNAYARLAWLALREGNGAGWIRNSLKAMELDPRDHEIPSRIALTLYQLGLIEEADEFRDRVLSIAPTSSAVYLLDMAREHSRGDEAACVAVARRAIENDIDNRMLAFVMSVDHLLRHAVHNGTVDEEMAYLDSNAPGIMDIYSETLPTKYIHSQQAAWESWYLQLPEDEFRARVDQYFRNRSNYGLGLINNTFVRIRLLAVKGDTEEAVELALDELFTKPVSAFLGWERAFELAYYSEFVADPRIQEAMRRWKDEETEFREQIRTYLADVNATE